MHAKPAIVGTIVLLTLSLTGCGFMSEQQAENWHWDGKLSSLSECTYDYIHLANKTESFWGNDFVGGKPAGIKDGIVFPGECETVYNWCFNKYQKEARYFNDQNNSC